MYIKMVVGSWGSYNACNERALGSEWIDLAEYSDWDDICDELARQGFDLAGIDEELFIQDIDSDLDIRVGEFESPEEFAQKIWDSDILNGDEELISAIVEAFGINEVFCSDLDNWQFYPSQTLEDLAWEFAQDYFTKETEFLERYFDYTAFARDLRDDGYIETSHGVIVRM